MTCLTPTTMEELAGGLESAGPGWKILGGGTDLVLQMQAGKTVPDGLVHLGRLPALCGIEEQGGVVTIGAMTSLQDVADSPCLQDSLAALAQAAACVGCVQIRNKGTIGGNIANASPAGDLLPALWLLGAQVEIAGAFGIRTVPISDLLLGPGRLAIDANEAIVRIRVRKSKGGARSVYQKLGSRREMTISRVSIAASVRVAGEVIEEIAIVAGAVAETPVRVPVAEQALRGSPLNDQTFAEAARSLSGQILESNKRPNRSYKAWASTGVLADVLRRLCPGMPFAEAPAAGA